MIRLWLEPTGSALGETLVAFGAATAFWGADDTTGGPDHGGTDAILS
jgi:hypothetical protein